MFISKIRKIGNAHGIIIPKKFLDKKNLSEGSEVVIEDIHSIDDDLFGVLNGHPSFIREHLKERKFA